MKVTTLTNGPCGPYITIPVKNISYICKKGDCSIMVHPIGAEHFEVSYKTKAERDEAFTAFTKLLHATK